MGSDSKDSERTVGKILQNSAKRFADRPFVYFGDEVVTYAKMEERALRAGGYFQSGSIKKGDKVLIFIGNCLEWLYVWYGLAKIGAVAVPLNTAHKGAILEYQINNSDAQILVTSKELFERIVTLEDKLTTLQKIIVSPDDKDLPPIKQRTISYAELMQSTPMVQDIEANYFDTMAIMYTSGTTGVSKGVVQPHNQFIWCGEQIAQQFKLTPDDVFYCWSPLFHIGGSGMFVMSTLLTGSSLALAETFSLRRFWPDIEKYKATISAGFATLMELLYKQTPKVDDGVNPLRHMMVGHPSESIRQDFEKRFNLVITDDYGMTEFEPISFSVVGELDRKPGTCGRPAQNVEVKIFDDDDNALKPGRVGEIVARPYRPFIMMQEYYKMPDQTLKAWRNLWFHTGDLGYLDEDGYLFFVDRKKDCIRRRGENISSIELENIINSHPCVLESAAVGVPSEPGDQDIKIVFTLKEGKTLTYEELMHFCQENMAFFMIPRYIEIVDAFPRNEASKILKKDLRDINKNTWDRESAGFKIKK